MIISVKYIWFIDENHTEQKSNKRGSQLYVCIVIFSYISCTTHTHTFHVVYRTATINTYFTICELSSATTHTWHCVSKLQPKTKPTAMHHKKRTFYTYRTFIHMSGKADTAHVPICSTIFPPHIHKCVPATTTHSCLCFNLPLFFNSLYFCRFAMK